MADASELPPFWPYRDLSTFVSAGDLTFHVQQLGDGPDIVLLHGTGASCHSFSGIMPYLAEQFRVTAFDLPGHGFSGSARGDALSLPGMARRCAALLETLDIAPTVTVGHSAGAAVCLQMAVESGIRAKLVIGLNAAVMPFRGVAKRTFPGIARALVTNPVFPYIVSAHALFGRSVERMIRSTGSDIEPLGQRCYRRLVRMPGHVQAAIGMMAAWELDGLAERAADVPAVFITASNDRTVRPSSSTEAARRMNAATVVRLGDLGHLAHEEAPEEIAEIMVAEATKRLA